ncbi:MAG: hypothetical protein M1827_006194 [Pycnora praestabilis]|nr:MAG: hypothetical protein M1827_006194 [Pycnora praestabilis]
MLGDNPEKSKNPLKKAMRRRNAKTVTFSAPTYVEASDFDYSSDEEAGDGENNGNEVNVVEAHSLQQEDQDEITAVEPLKVRSQGQDGRIEPLAAEAVPKEDGKLDGKAPTDTLRTSDEMFDRQVDGVFAKSRNGIVRDTDSFFKDDNVETRKITLTPNLLRDDSSSSTVRSVDSKELKSRGSSEAIEKAITSPERAKDDRRKKEKKSGMLSGLFKRKDKKSKGQDDEAEETEKISGELLRESPQPKGSGDVSPADSMNAVQAQQQPPRQTAKLQKQPPLAKLSPVREPSATQAPQTREPVGRPVPAPERPAPTAIEDRPAIRFVSPDVDRSHEDGILASRVRSPDQQPRDQIISLEAPMDTNQSSGKFSPITNMLRSSSSATETRPEKVKKAKKRVELDDFDSSPEAQEPADPLEDPIESHELEPESMVPNERLSESPVQVSPVDAHISNPPALMVDSSSQEDPSVSTSSPPSSPELIDAQEAHDTKLSEVTPDSTTLSSTTAPVWSDASLRTYLEDNSDVKDLLVVVHDKSEAVSPGPDHPFTAALFKNENRRLVEISNQLDGILGDWLARKSRIAAQ